MDLAGIQKKLNKNIFGKILLTPLSFLYGFAVILKLKAYEKNILKTKKTNSKIICIGNLSTGGTGKTTAVMFTAKILADEKIKTAIVSRGYKGKLPKNEVMTVDENTTDFKQCGDEPYMMYKALQQYKIPVVVSSNRYKAAQEAVKKFKPETILLDDGFSHIKLKRNTNIVLIDTRSGFLNDKLLPLGNLREPKKSLKRADIVLLTHCNLTHKDTLNKIYEDIKQYNSKVEIIETHHKPTYYFDVCASQKIELDKIKGKAVSLCGLGNPKSFEETLEKLKLELTQIWRYPDHHSFTIEELENIYKLKGEAPLITTYKDFVRFPENWREILKEKVYFLSINLEILGGEKKLSLFKQLLIK